MKCLTLFRKQEMRKPTYFTAVDYFDDLFYLIRIVFLL